MKCRESNQRSDGQTSDTLTSRPMRQSNIFLLNNKNNYWFKSVKILIPKYDFGRSDLLNQQPFKKSSRRACFLQKKNYFEEDDIDV